MRININEIKVNSDRRKASADDIQKLADSIDEVGMMNPITVDADHNLIAGLHRLEAAKLLGWSEIECSVCELDELHAELAKIDENYIRANLTPLETSQLMFRRKEIYETLHPETKAGAAQGNGMKRSTEDDGLADKLSAKPKSFAQGTAEKLGVDERTVRRQVKIAKDLTPEAQQIIEESGMKVTQQNLDKLSRLEPEQQKEAAEKLMSSEQAKDNDHSTCQEVEDDEEEESELANKFVPREFIVRFLEEFQHYSEHFPRRLSGFFEDYDACGELLTAEERQTLRQQVASMMDVLTALSEKMHPRESQNADTTTAIA